MQAVTDQVFEPIYDEDHGLIKDDPFVVVYVIHSLMINFALESDYDTTDWHPNFDLTYQFSPLNQRSTLKLRAVLKRTSKHLFASCKDELPPSGIAFWNAIAPICYSSYISINKHLCLDTIAQEPYMQDIEAAFRWYKTMPQHLKKSRPELKISFKITCVFAGGLPMKTVNQY